MKLAEVTKLDENGAREYLEKVRWPKGAVCPHCKGTDSVKLAGKSTRPGLYKCKNKECRKQFTVTVGTIFERSHVPLRDWVIAFHLMCSSKKGVSAHQIHRSVGCTYKTAWFMCHRIRHAMTVGPNAPKLSGVIEADETYVGGKARPGSRTGRGTSKAPVVALVQRNGDVRAVAVANITAKTIRKHLLENADTSATLMTDDLRLYTVVGRQFARHGVIKHSAGQYGKGDIYTNTIEGFFALVKRGVYGNFHHVSKEHLQKYVDEFVFRYNLRKVNDGSRRDAAVKAVAGKRLTYR